MDMMKDLHEMCETVSKAISQANDKIRTAGGKVSTADVDYIDKLTHALKSIKATMAMEGGEDGEEGGSYGSYARDGRYSRRMYRGSYDDGSYDDGSYARGRGRYANRDSMGRYSSDGYSREGYSRDGGMVDELRDLMNRAPDDQTRQEFQRMIQKMEQR